MKKFKLAYELPRVRPARIGRIYGRFASDVRPHRGRLAASAAALLGVSAVTILQPWPLKVVFDHVLIPAQGRSGWLVGLVGGLSRGQIIAAAAVSVLALAATKGLLAYFQTVQARVVGHRLVADIRLRLFSHVQRLPQSYHDFSETGELMTRVTGDVDLLKDLLVSTTIELTSHVVLVAGMLVVLFTIDTQLALVAVATMPVFLVAAFGYSGRIKASARKQREAYGKIVAAVQESLVGIAQVKGMAQEKKREKLVGRSIGRDFKANVRTTRLTANYERTVELIAAAGTGAVLWIGAHRVLTGTMTPGDLLIVISYLRGMYRPLRRVARLSARTSKATARAEKIIETFDMTAEVRDAAGARSAAGIRGDIEFDDVEFAYVKEHPVLCGVTCRIPARKTTVILGPTGAGKSTIAKLVLRLYDTSGGRVLLDGRSIDTYRIASLRKRITPVSQETFLFRSSVADNIAFGVGKASRAEVEEAAERVGADTFIHGLPEGFDTLVGEGGVTLSGGQRQRVSFARALLRRAPVMIFDEPATGLDIHAEGESREVLARLRGLSTLVVITHRVQFLEIADHVVFVNDGRVVEQGEPGKLLAAGGRVSEFVRRARSGYNGIPAKIRGNEQVAE